MVKWQLIKVDQFRHHLLTVQCPRQFVETVPPFMGKCPTMDARVMIG
jgi:hypothetical protein